MFSAMPQPISPWCSMRERKSLRTTMPGALCEPLFLTDSGEQALAESKAGQKALAKAFANAIDAYFGSKKP